MKTTKNISIALFLAVASAAAGCAGSDTGDDTSPGDDDVMPGDDEPAVPTTPIGKFAVQSEFDMATGLPGTVGQVVNQFIAATDGSDDPGRWMCDLAADQVGGTAGDIAHGVCAVVGGIINDQLLSIAPDFVSTLILLGDDFGDIAKNFGLRSELEIAASGAAFTAKHTVNGLNFKLDNVDHVFPMADYGMTLPPIANVAVTYTSVGALTIAAHDIPLSYGTLLRIGLDELIIPAIDPFADGLGELLQNTVDCDAVGEAIYNSLPFPLGSGSTWASACRSGLTAGANLIYQQITRLNDAAVKFGVTGEARATDTNGDKQCDEITRGKWNGTLSIGGTMSPLVNSTFAGRRM